MQNIAEGGVGARHSMRDHKKITNVQKIGVIERSKENIATVKRGSHHEAVVGIQVKPISDLVTSRKLKRRCKRCWYNTLNAMDTLLVHVSIISICLLLQFINP